MRKAGLCAPGPLCGTTQRSNISRKFAQRSFDLVVANEIEILREYSDRMTAEQLYLFNGLYLMAFVVLAFLTRATTRRMIGALAGGLAAGMIALLVVVLGEKMQWWHQTIRWEPRIVTLNLLSFALCGFVFLICWRLERRFGSKALTVPLLAVALIGPPRDYWYMSHFPEWGTYNWNIATVLAVSATYALLGVVGYGVMRFIAGPARGDALRRSGTRRGHSRNL